MNIYKFQSNLKLWQEDEKGFKLSVEEIKCEILIIFQFTLFVNCKKGCKLNFNQVQESKEAKEIYSELIEKLKQKIHLKI